MSKQTQQTQPAEQVMTTADMRSYASTLGIKVIGLTNEKLKAQINVPEVDEEVKVVRKKLEGPIDCTYKGFFRCKISGKYYARLQSGKKKFIKQLQKVQRNENATPQTDAE